MVTRRRILQAVGGVGLAAAIPHSIARADGSVPLHRVVFDSHHEQSVRFETEARRRGVETSDTRGDVAALYVRDLMPRWRESAIAVAGLTAHSQLFGLRLLAETPRLRLVFLQEMESGDAYGPATVCKAARSPDPAAIASLLCKWPARYATVARRRSNILSAQDHLFTNDALVAWLMAPVPA
jgi:hypothetical protein